MSATSKFPEVHVQLSGRDSNAFTVLGACEKAARRAGIDPAEISAFMDEATSGDYDHLLATAMRWFEVG